MLIVPVTGDRIKTADGLPAKVLSYSNYKTEGPAVITDGEGPAQSVPFNEITKINDQRVKLLKNAEGYNVFETSGFMDRTFQIPQPGDIITSTVSGVEAREYEVVRVRLHVKDQLSRGMILDCNDQETHEETEVMLGQIKDIAHTIFNHKKFLGYYADYCEKGAV